MRRPDFSSVVLWLGLLFIYLPMVILVIYSFNASRLVTVWGGWSVHWYLGLLDNTQLMGAVKRSLQIAFYTATAAVVLGTMAAFAMTRISQFRGRTLFSGMVTAPLVMPEVITGLSLLLLFVALAQILESLFGVLFDRGMLTIWIAHTTFSVAYVAIVVSSRLGELDQSIEEAALDLGAPPWKTFLQITVPMIAPSIVAGWLLAFTLSLDDLVLASFVSGPGSTTLPMEIFSAVRLGVKPEINAIASVILLAVSLFTLLVWFIFRRADRRSRMPLPDETPAR
ncbi:ABC transporter permease subunit [Pseudomonas sp. FME51]|uniref:ABC transporter permease subunit n=1 Tax=Pseudomonas sp. FME51 TaxID=2742609 RepID=UPI001867C69F|nr:ABC transporter permease subunit [Pseudomonas sp. FME51]